MKGLVAATALLGLLVVAQLPEQLMECGHGRPTDRECHLTAQKPEPRTPIPDKEMP